MKLATKDIINMMPDETNWQVMLSYLQKHSIPADSIEFYHIVNALGLDVASQMLHVSHKALGRLFDVMCAKQAFHLIDNPRSKRAIEIAESYINNCSSDTDLQEAYNSALNVYQSNPSAINAIAVLVSRLNDNCTVYQTYKSTSSAVKIALWNETCHQQEQLLCSLSVPNIALRDIDALLSTQSLTIINDNRAKGRLVILKENSVIRKYWFFKNNMWVKEHVKILNNIVPGYVKNYGQDELGIWIDFNFLPGTPASSIPHTDDFIKKLYSMCLDYNKKLAPYSHGDWVLSNMFIHNDQLLMCDWDDVGRYPEDVVLENIKKSFQSEFGNQFNNMISEK